MADIIEFTTPSADGTLRLLRDATTGCFHHMRSTFTNCDSLVWANPYGLTPQQVFDAIGARAAGLVDFLTRVAVAINALAPLELRIASSKPAGVVLVVNGNGTVTLS
jgi:hypothetical protein